MPAFRSLTGIVVVEGVLLDSDNYIGIPLTFDTPGLVLTGVPVYTPQPGDLLVAAAISIPTTAWNGTTPKLNVYSEGDDPDTDQLAPPFDLATLSQAAGTHATLAQPGISSPVVFSDDTPVLVNVDDGAGGDPGSSQGEGTLILAVVPVP